IMSRIPEGVNKITESAYKNVMEQFNPGLRNLVNLGKTYEKSVAAMTLAGRAYFDAVSKLGEVAIVSPASRELVLSPTSTRCYLPCKSKCPKQASGKNTNLKATQI
uniref:IMD domain-containing protein n=1 Tax=Oryzias latipes TaxID=8090 RepID=A0A3P9LT21_ORYLA